MRSIQRRSIHARSPQLHAPRLAEKLAQYICSLTRRAESLATPETECLLYATYWFRPILSELIGAAMESADMNRERAPSGPRESCGHQPAPLSAPQWQSFSFKEQLPLIATVAA